MRILNPLNVDMNEIDKKCIGVPGQVFLMLLTHICYSNLPQHLRMASCNQTAHYKAQLYLL